MINFDNLATTVSHKIIWEDEKILKQVREFISTFTKL